MAVQTGLSQVLDLLQSLADDALTGAPAQIARGQVDRQIQCLLKADAILHDLVLPAFYRRLNDTAPISQFPDEILLSIFMLCRDSDKQLHSTAGRPGWMAVTYVCARWRSICLSCPLLWNCIVSFMTDAWIDLFIRRSGDVPLDLSIKYRGHSSQVLDTIMSQSQRWRNMRIDAIAQDMVSLFPFNIQSRFLKSLSLRDDSHNAWGYIGPSIDVTRAGILLPDTMFDRCTPALCHLTLDSAFRITASSPILPHLISLECSINLTEGGILNLLASTRKLTSLRINEGRLGFSASDLPPIVPLPDGHIPLTVLQLLDISTYHPLHFLAVFPALHLPSIKRIHLAFRSWSTVCEALFEGLSPHVKNLQSSDAPVYAMGLGCGSRSGFTLMCWSETNAKAAPPSRLLSHSHVQNEDKASICMRCVESRNAYDWWRCIPISFYLFGRQFKGLRVLKLNIGCYLAPALWQVWLKIFRGAEVLDVYEYYTEHDPDREARPCLILDGIISKGPTPSCSLPRLKKVIYSYAKIRPRGGHFLGSLQRLAECRKAAGTRLEIDFPDAGLYSNHVTSVLEKLAKVTWGGEEIPSFSLDEGENDALDEMWKQLFGP